MSETAAIDCDMLVVGSGAAGLIAAITARRLGLGVIVAEKTGFYGGTTATPRGFAWLPCNRLARYAGIADGREKALDYLRAEAGNRFNRERAEAFVENAGAMLDSIERDSEMKFFLAPDFPDYHLDAPGGMRGGRSLGPSPTRAAGSVRISRRCGIRCRRSPSSAFSWDRGKRSSLISISPARYDRPGSSRAARRVTSSI